MSNMKLPETAILELTYACNHKCMFCSCPWESPEGNYERREELTVDEWKGALRILQSRGVKRVGLSGGEPLLKDGFREILRHIRSDTKLNEGRKITVITNGAAMNEEYISLFKETDAHLAFSLPGLTTFEYHTGQNGNSAAKVLHWVRRAKAEGISVTLNVTTTKKNIYELYVTIGNGILAGADSLLLNRFMAGGRGLTNLDDLSLSREDICQMLDVAEDLLETTGRYGSLGIEVPLCVLDGGEEKYKRLHIDSMCGAARNFFTVDPSGYIRVCNHSPNQVGYVFDKDVITAPEYWRVYTERAHGLPKMCGDCDKKDRCDCGCREAAAICYGLLSAPDPCVEDMNR